MIKCEICGREYLMVGHLHLRIHGVSWMQYKTMFPHVQRMYSPEMSAKLSERNKGNTYRLGIPNSEETRQKMSLSHMGMQNSLGYHHTKEAKEKMSIQRKGNTYCLGIHHNEETKARISQSLLGNTRTLGYKKTIEQRLRQKEAMSNPEVRAKMRKSRREWLNRNNGKLPEAQRQKISETVRRRSKDPEYRAKLSAGKRKLWENPEYRQNCTTAVARALAKHPNRPETQLLRMLGEGWKFTGGGGLVVHGRMPDFWNGNHKVIELYGDYWHRGENPQERIDCFNQYGYECLVIWEHELLNEGGVQSKVLAFTQKSKH